MSIDEMVDFLCENYCADCPDMSYRVDFYHKQLVRPDGFVRDRLGCEYVIMMANPDGSYFYTATDYDIDKLIRNKQAEILSFKSLTMDFDNLNAIIYPKIPNKEC